MKYKYKIPNGGWGWLVVIGAAVTNMLNQSLFSLFGLLFGEKLELMGHSTMGIALVMNINSMVTNFSGIFTGPILKNYSARIVTLVGVLLTSAGMILSSVATNISHIIVGYSVLTGLGLGLIMPATFLIVNTYFTSRRGQAVGLSMAGTSVGQMLMPQVVRLLLDSYGYSGTTLILGGLCLNGIAGALLFQPVEWHMKKVEFIETTEDAALIAKEEVKFSTLSNNYKQVNLDAESNTLKDGRVVGCLNKLADRLDLNLLNDFVFIHIITGLALVYTCSVAFSMIFPLFLQEGVQLTRADTALCMSLLSGADIVSRLTVPLITKRFKIGARMTFLIGSVLLAFARSFLAQQTTFTWIVVGSLLCGYIRAASVVNQNLTVSEYCSESSLPAALGLNMVAKGVFVLSAGQFLGWLRDYTHSFSLCIHYQNIILISVAISWTLEIGIRSRFNTK